MKNQKNEKSLSIQAITLGLLIAALFVVGYNAIQINALESAISNGYAANPGSQGASSLASSIDVIPKGAPPIYGPELKVSFDDISAYDSQKADETIRKLGALDQQIALEGKGLERYIAIVSQISCEYCCGAKSIIFADGQPACGCAHSYAMRGLAKYLITKHGDEYTDDQILEELGKWKTLFFPSQITAKAEIMKQKGIELNYINLASNKYRGIEKQTSGSGMVGGC